MNKEIRLILDELKSGLSRVYGKQLKHLFLYGSYARDEAEAGSDIDVLMILSNFDSLWVEVQRNSELVSDICLKYGIVISLIPIREINYKIRKTPFILNVKKEGIAL